MDSGRVIPVKDAAGRLIGGFVGAPVDPENAVLISSEFQTRRELTDDIDHFIEDEIYRLAGRFVFILDIEGARRIYLDAMGSMPVVYSAARRAAASTGVNILGEDDRQDLFRSESYKTLDVEREGWFTGTITAHKTIDRLLPNFYLDLDSYTTHRHWPLEAIPESRDPEQVCAGIAGNVAAQIQAYLKAGEVSACLTAGNDSRIVLACARDVADRIRFATVGFSGARMDIGVSRVLAKTFGLKHEVFAPVAADDAEIGLWRKQTDYGIGGPLIRYHPCSARIAGKGVYLGGFGGEVGRAFFWGKRDSNSAGLTAKSLYASLGLPFDQASFDSVSDWLKTVSHFPVTLQLDLAYIELRMASWHFASAYAANQRAEVHPLGSRANFAGMLSLPAEWRIEKNGTNEMITSIIRQSWSELLSVPINGAGAMGLLLTKLGKAVRNPAVVSKKLRKLSAALR